MKTDEMYISELEKSQRALEETVLLCGKCQEERKARDAKAKDVLERVVKCSECRGACSQCRLMIKELLVVLGGD